MLIASNRSQIFVSQELGYGVNIRALHSHPTGCRVSQIMKMKICNADSLTRAAKSSAHTDGRDCNPADDLIASVIIAIVFAVRS